MQKEIKNINNCLICNKRLTKIRKKDTANITKICTNSKCSLFIDLDKVKNWI